MENSTNIQETHGFSAEWLGTTCEQSLLSRICKKQVDTLRKKKKKCLYIEPSSSKGTAPLKAPVFLRVSPLTLHPLPFPRKPSPHLYQGTKFSPDHIFAVIQKRKSIHYRSVHWEQLWKATIHSIYGLNSYFFTTEDLQDFRQTSLQAPQINAVIIGSIGCLWIDTSYSYIF